MCLLCSTVCSTAGTTYSLLTFLLLSLGHRWGHSFCVLTTPRSRPLCPYHAKVGTFASQVCKCLRSLNPVPSQSSFEYCKIKKKNKNKNLFFFYLFVHKKHSWKQCRIDCRLLSFIYSTAQWTKINSFHRCFKK